MKINNSRDIGGYNILCVLSFGIVAMIRCVMTRAIREALKD